MQRVAPRVASDSPSATSETPSVRPAEPFRGLPRERRIRKRADFREVYDRGGRLGSKLFAVYGLATGTSRPARMGLTVTRKIGGAATRNRCKRLLREAVRTRWSLLPDGVDVVLHARRGLIGVQLRDVERDVARLLPRLVRRLAEPRRGKR